ncbi:MAG: caspase family protein [Thermodesulfobacteriota bacterium]
MYKTKYVLKRLLLSFAIIACSGNAFAAEKSDHERISQGTDTEGSAQVFVQLGHTGGIKSVTFSPDGRYALSGSTDHTLKLWEISTGREMRTFTGHTNNVASVAFSPDGRYALSGSEDKTLKLWDIATWRAIRTFKGHSKEVNSAVFSADGRYILSSSEDGTVKLWDASTGKEIRTFTYVGEEIVRQPDGRLERIKVTGTRSRESAIFSPDMKYVLSGGREGIKLWDIETGKEIIRQFVGSGIAVSPDGKYVLSLLFKTLKLWDIGTGKEIWTSVELPNYIQSIAFSPDSKYALSGDQGGAVKLWDISTGREIRTFTGHLPLVASVAFSPDGRYALSGSMNDRAIKIWDVEAGKEIKNLGRQVYGVSSISFSKDGRYVLAGNGTNLCLWDVLSGIKIRTFSGHQETVYSAALSPDDRYAASGGEDKTLKLWDVSTGTEKKTLMGHTDRILSVAFSPDGRYVLSGGPDNTLRLWEVATGKVARTILGSGSKGQFTEAVFLPNGRFVMSSYMDLSSAFNPVTTLRLFDISAGKQVKFISPGAFGMSVSPDGRYVFSNMFQLVEIDSGQAVRNFSPKGYAAKSAFSQDGNYLLTTGEKNLLLWDVATGGKIREFKGHIDNTYPASFSPADSRYVVSGGSDGTIRLWNIHTGGEIARFVGFIDGEWIVITPEGYYNSSVNGDKHLNVRIGNNVYGIDQYRSAFYKPQIVEAALRLGDTQKAIAETIGVDKEKPAVTVASIQNIEPPFIVIKSPEDGKKMSSSDAEVSLYIEDRNQTIRNVKVYVNGRQVTGSEASPRLVGARNDIRGIKITHKGIEVPEGKKTLDLKIPVHLETGENLIEVMAFNGFSEGRKSIRIYLEVAGQASRLSEAILPNLWILSIGINKYQDKNLTPLSYAVADAEGVVEAFKSQKGKLFREVNNLIMNDNSPIKPTRDNITDNLDYVKKAGHNDVVILFIAGHGINDDSGEFYFLPSDAVISEDGSIKKSKAISWRDIKAILDIPAKKIIFADTCHSEGVSGKKTRGVDNDRFVKELQEANAVIFTSSRGRELSQESDKWRHGAFTYALIEGIKGKANLIKDNKISMKELDTYVSETVPQLTNGAQHPITNTPDGYVNFPVAVVE